MASSGFAPDSRFGRYRIVQELGRGGMGAVLRAEDAGTGQPVALKVILGEHRTDEAFLARFRREARAAAAVAHPGIVRLVDSGVEAGCPFIAFELVAGGSLAGRLKKAGPLPWREVAAIGAEVAHALAAVHAAGLVHRDLKPDNVLVGPGGRPKISDFGLVRASGGAVLGTTGVLTKTGELLGTPAYASPEQVDGARAIDARTDLYGLGATLFALLTARPPFEGEGYSVVKRVLLERPPAVGKLAKDTPERLERLVGALLEKEPAKRPQTAGEVARELEAIARGETGTRRRGFLAVAGLALVAVLAVAASAYALRGREKPSPSLPVPPPAPSPDPKLTPPPPRPAKNEPPEWYRNLAKDKKPPLPLPTGLRLGSEPREYVNEKDGSVLVYVPKGAFLMGGDPIKDESHGPRHRVELTKPYYVGKYEVSNEQFERFVKATGYETMADTQGGHVRVRSQLLQREDSADDAAEGWELRRGASWRRPTAEGECDLAHPVVHVNFEDARAYCKWASLRLPTEAEWERAASGPHEGDPYPWGSAHPGEEALKRANIGDLALKRRRPEFVLHPKWSPAYDDGLERTAPVRVFADGASEFGAVNMIGNVWEWCADRWADDFYAHGPREDPFNIPDASAPVQSRVLRGGSFLTEWATVYRRRGLSITYSCDDLGFRVARDAR